MIPLTFRHPTLDDAAMLLDWRTRPEITRSMFTDLVDPSLEKQRAWLERAATRDDYAHFVMQWAGEPIGYLSYEIDRANRRCTPGYYLVLEPSRRWIGGFTFSFVVDYALYGLGMNKLVYYIMSANEKFVRGKRILGAREVGVLEAHVLKDGQFHDVHVFELTEERWRSTKRLFPREATLAAFPPLEPDGVRTSKG